MDHDPGPWNNPEIWVGFTWTSGDIYPQDFDLKKVDKVDVKYNTLRTPIAGMLVGMGLVRLADRSRLYLGRAQHPSSVRLVRPLLLLFSLATVDLSWSQSYAMALHLPKDAVSFCILNDKSAWGFDFGLKTDKDHSITSHSIDRRFIKIGAVYQRMAWDTDGDVEPLLFLRLNGSLDAIKPGWDLRVPGDPHQVREWEGIVTVGPAVSWKPYKHVSLWVRQGISFARWWTESKDWPPDMNGGWYSLRISSPVVLAVFMW